MGNQRSAELLQLQDHPNRQIFIKFDSFHHWSEESGDVHHSFIFLIRYQRYQWKISKRFTDVLKLDNDLWNLYPEIIELIKVPRKYPKLLWSHDDPLLLRRANDMAIYLQTIVDNERLFEARFVKEFLGIGETSLRPMYGRKGKEGYVEKCSGGYHENYSTRAGDFIKTWRTRWLALHDNYIAYYETSGDIRPLGCLQIDQKFLVKIIGKLVTISNGSRNLIIRGSTQREATEWAEALASFYRISPKRIPQLYDAHFPPRPQTSVKLYSCGKDYFLALAIALLQAKEEILLASWMVSPTLILTRPPLPPVRLDQILKHKAEIGVKIFVLLYKEVEMSGLGNDSMRCKNYLESLNSHNIYVIRHPNKLIGGSTALLWSHHEKIVVVDRKIGFVGGIDPCFGRWDDESMVITDEEGLKFPGRDYYQPQRGLFTPVKGGSGSIVHASIEENIFYNVYTVSKSEDDRSMKESVSESILDENRETEPTSERSFLSNNILAKLQTISTNQMNSIDGEVTTKIRTRIFQTRELYPRMPWHDVHGCVTGLPARDLAAHFVQRWNHHRASKSDIDKPTLTDITDNPYYSVCARCELEKIYELEEKCPSCGYDLGPIKLPLFFRDLERHPSSKVSSITFQLLFNDKLGCRIQGVGPVVISEIVDATVFSDDSTGKLLFYEGHPQDIRQLCDQTLRPQIGDILVAIDNKTVLHLNSSQINRLIKSLIQQNDRVGPFTLVLRRYDITKDQKLQKHDRKVKLIQEELSKSTNVIAMENQESTIPSSLNQQEEPRIVSAASGVLTNEELEWNHQQARVDLVCDISLDHEVLHCIRLLEAQMGDILPNSDPLKGSCLVQVLRSVGPWSVGHTRECSIQNCWVESIRQAAHFIYIENQFFIGDLVGEESTTNSIPRAILDRLVLAVERNEAFKAIILLPFHPEGDFLSSSGPLGVMHFQYQTISRGMKSLIEQFKLRTSADPFDYICFCSLRNWGQLSDKLLVEQIYVHDKLLIVDDRILIMGSANINDRSMLGDRDSEVAIRIEDTNHMEGRMNGRPWMVGVIPHLFRIRLMKKHLNNMNIDITDPICDDFYKNIWQSIAKSNSEIYNQLDSTSSYESCRTLEEYRASLASKPLHDINDSNLNLSSQLNNINGFLVLWPIKFLEDEVISMTHSVAKDLFI